MFKRMTCEDLCLEYLRYVELKGRKKSTIATYHTRIYKHILPLLPVNAKKINDRDITRAFLEKMKTTSKNHYVDIVILTNAILKYAYEKRYVKSYIKLPVPCKDVKEIEVFPDEEQIVLIEYLLNHLNNLNYGFLLKLLAGLRVGELSALKLKALNRFRVKILRTLQRIKNLLSNGKSKTIIIEDEPKSSFSKRSIPLVELLQKCYDKISKTNEEHYLLTDSFKYIEPRQLEREFAKILRACNLPYRNLHALRHTFATNCVRAGVDIKVLAELMGHSNTSITLKYYIFVDYEIKEKSIEKLSNKWNFERVWKYNPCLKDKYAYQS